MPLAFTKNNIPEGEEKWRKGGAGVLNRVGITEETSRVSRGGRQGSPNSRPKMPPLPGQLKEAHAGDPGSVGNREPGLWIVTLQCLSEGL